MNRPRPALVSLSAAAALAALVLIPALLLSQPMPPVPPPAGPAPPPAAALTLSPPSTVDFKPGKLLVVTAKGAPAVAWMVHTFPKTELDYAPQGLSLVLAMPPPGVEVWVVAAADGQQLAETTVTVKGQAQAPAPAPGDAKPAGKVRHATVIFDGQALPAAVKALRDSAPLKAACAARGVKFRALDVRDPDAKALGLDVYFGQAGGVPVLVLQEESGSVIPPGQVFKIVATGDAAADARALLQLIDAQR